MPLEQFKNTVRLFVNEFLNDKTDESIDDNLRWAIFKKVIKKILESCDLTYLAELMIVYTKDFESILNQPY